MKQSIVAWVYWSTCRQRWYVTCPGICLACSILNHRSTYYYLCQVHTKFIHCSHSMLPILGSKFYYNFKDHCQHWKISYFQSDKIIFWLLEWRGSLELQSLSADVISKEYPLKAEIQQYIWTILSRPLLVENASQSRFEMRQEKTKLVRMSWSDVYWEPHVVGNRV